MNLFLPLCILTGRRGMSTMMTGQVVELTAEHFAEQILDAQQPMLVDFWASWCAPCRLMAPVVGALAETFADRLIVGKVNVDRYPDLAVQSGVRSIPTLMLFQHGILGHTWVGAQPQEYLVRELAHLLSHQATHS